MFRPNALNVNQKPALFWKILVAGTKCSINKVNLN